MVSLGESIFEGAKHPLYVIVIIIGSILLGLCMYYTWNGQDRTPQEIADWLLQDPETREYVKRRLNE